MAKRGVIDHPKNLALAKALKTVPGVSLGLLESTWHWISRLKDWRQLSAEDLTDSFDHAGWLHLFDRSQLIAALLNTGWLQQLSVDIYKPSRLFVGYICDTKRQRRWAHVKAAGGELPQEIRDAVHAAHDWKCKACGRTEDLTVDHIVAISNGGTNHISNLQTLCRPCNSRKKDREGNQ